MLCAADVVLTSYDALERSGPLTPLFGLHWHRIVIDEVQMVGAGSAGARGTLSRRAENAMALESANRWCVSGTPLEAAKDVGGILRFLKHQPWSDPVW